MGCSFIIFFLLSQSALAFTFTLTQNGIPTRWIDPPYISLIGNPSNHTGLSDLAMFQAVVRGLSRWQAASQDGIRFDYWQGRDSVTFSPKAELNGFSNLFFASQIQGGKHLPSQVLGLTHLWFHPDSGKIFEADIILNDEHYHFTTDPQDTSGFGSAESGTGRDVFVENVLTHELGHAWGMSHSGVMQSSMLFVESPEQAYLGCDDQAGIFNLYGPFWKKRHLGSIVGTVVTAKDSLPVFGAHVLAISQDRAVVRAATLTHRSGDFRIDFLEAGKYLLMVEPFYGGNSALPSYYSGSEGKICHSRDWFSRNFGTSSLEVQPGKETQAPQLFAICAERGDPVVSDPEILLLSENLGDPVSHRFQQATFFSKNLSPRVYELQSIQGNLEVHVLSYSLYSPVQTSLLLFDSTGTTVKAEISTRRFEGRSGFIDYDASLRAINLPFGNYLLKILGYPLSPFLYPGGAFAIDSNPFFLILGHLNKKEVLPPSPFPGSARCKMEENFPPYSSPTALPTPHFMDPQLSYFADPNRDDQSFSFCGRISDSNPRDPSSAPLSHILLGWVLSFWVWVLLVWWFVKKVESRTESCTSELAALN